MRLLQKRQNWISKQIRDTATTGNIPELQVAEMYFGLGITVLIKKRSSLLCSDQNLWMKV